MDSEQTPINGALKGRPQMPALVENAVLAFKDRILWPLEDNFALLGDRARVGVTAGSAIVVAAIVAGGVILGSGSGSGSSAEPAAAQVAVATPPGNFGIPPAPSAPAPTLHGATPTFKAPVKKQKQDSSGVEAAKATETPTTTASTGAGTSAATEKISSQPSASTATATSSAAAEAASVPGPEAGAKATAVARDFSDAFVVYETGGEESKVRAVFADTATPDLAKALLKRPPRLPADVKVPKAKVLNVVPGPSREGVYTLSVSLLRVGVTSELRLEMEQVKGEGWRVTNVLG
ncbi:MAG TPA: hypothetical protein VLL27_11645 [Solirubrobacterales bacterium]|nr:hypothetical protein [Solirubrobacterales bacterium]